MNDCELLTLGCGAVGVAAVILWRLWLAFGDWRSRRIAMARLAGRKEKRSRYRGSAGLVILIVVGLLALVTMIGYLAGDSESNHCPSPTGPRPAEYAQFEAAVREAIASGALHSVDPESGTVRMGASIWVGLTLEQKRDSLRVWRAYFQSLGKSGRVRVLCDRNDTVFATLDSWNGAKILW